MKKIFLLTFLLPVFSFRPSTNGQDFFFGDSITFGNELGSLQYTARWSTQYCNVISSDEVNDAHSGEAMTPGLNAGRPVFDLGTVPVYQATNRHIFVSYWVNDYCYGGTPAAFAASTTAAVNGIIAKGWPAAKIVLCFNYLPESPGTWVNMTPAKAQQWLAALRGVQQAKGTSFLDFYTLINNRTDKASYTSDLIHPTAAWNIIMKQYTETNIEGPSTTLPVTFAGFSGQRLGAITTLKWTVAQEHEVVRYEVLRSSGSESWIRVGEVPSVGNTTLQRTYGFTDNNAGTGKQLYRLLVVDANGATKLSNVIILNGIKIPSVSVSGLFPNPAAARLNLVINAPAKETLTLSLVDVLGHAIKSRREAVEPGANAVDLNLSDVKSGVYLLNVISEQSGILSVERFVKE